MTFHTAEELWLEIGVNQESLHLIPANMLAEGVVFIRINSQIVQDKFKALKAVKELQGFKAEVTRNFEPCLYLQDNLVLKNFDLNCAKYNKAYSSDFLNFEFVEETFREVLEYHTIDEFNRVRAKEFIPFAGAFHGVYQESNRKQPFVSNYTKILVEKLRQFTGNPDA